MLIAIIESASSRRQQNGDRLELRRHDLTARERLANRNS
jgi:hypothetical protein